MVSFLNIFLISYSVIVWVEINYFVFSRVMFFVCSFFRIDIEYIINFGYKIWNKCMNFK